MVCGPLALIVAGGYALLEFGQFALLARRHYILAGLAHVLKWLILPILSYIWHLYDERLLRYSWIRWTYGMYMYAHELIVGWVHKQEWYSRVLAFKNRYVESVRKYLAVARAGFGRWRRALHRRNTVFNAARRLRRYRFRPS